MKKSNSFSEFRKQSLGVIAVAIVNYLQSIVRQVLWPVIILYVFGKGTDTFTQAIIYISIFTGSFSIIASVFRYTHFYFAIQQGKLKVRRGVLTTRNISVPFEKIQRVEFEQNIMHRLLSLVTIRVETAGAEEEEVEIGALPIPEAEELRAILLSAKKDKAHSAEEEAVVKEEDRLIFSLSIFDLLKAGLLRNHLQTFGVVLGFLIGLYFQFEDVLELDEVWFEMFPQWYYSGDQWKIIFYFLPIVFIFVILLTLVRTVLQYFGFKMWRKEAGYQVAYGAFNRTTYSSLDQKVQYLFWRDNVLMRLVGMFSLSIYQAGSVALRRSQSIIVPYCYDRQINVIQTDIYKNVSSPLYKYAPHSSYLGLLISRYGLLPVVIFALISLLRGETMASLIWGVTWLAIVALWSWFYHRSMRLSMDDRYIRVQWGVFSKKHWLLQYNKLQGVSLKSNPVENYRGLLSLELHSAAGDVHFPYLPSEDAHRLADEILYRIESEQVPWM